MFPGSHPGFLQAVIAENNMIAISKFFGLMVVGFGFLRMQVDLFKRSIGA
jgi:hypothetical protein